MKKLDIFKKLRTSGLRPTKQRVEIAKFLFDRDTTFHFTIESLENHLTKKTSCKFALNVNSYFVSNLLSLRLSLS